MSKTTKMVWQKHRDFTAYKPAKTLKLIQGRCKSWLRGRGGEESLGGCESLAEFRVKL